MRKILLLLVNLSFITIYAQTQIATLNHQGEISTFYSASSLKRAYEQAVNGDVITLSSGTFNAVNIEKLITIRGAGMGVKRSNDDINVESTIINGDFQITADGSGSDHLTLEGIVSNSTVTLRGVFNAQFIKCQFSVMEFDAGHGSFENLTLVHCYVSKEFRPLYNISLSAINCVFINSSFRGTGCLFSLYNCIVEYKDDRAYTLYDCALQNCIIINRYANIYAESASIYHSLWAGPYSGETPFKNASQDHNNYVIESDDNLFREGTFFQLTDEGQKYLGSDGTELGIYGGNMPFTPQLSTAQITRFDVSPKTTADGKLSIDIEIQTAD